LIQDHIQSFFPNFTAALSKQTPTEHENGRCAVVEYIDDVHPQPTLFTGSVELRQYLLATSPKFGDDGLPKKLPKRLFILEDLPCSYILALGSRLRIPPSFFAGHYDDPATSTFNHRNPFQRSSKSQLRIRYATSNRVEVDDASRTNGGVYAFNSNVCRYLHTYDPKGLINDEARSHHMVSFWSSPIREDGTWDAVLLVDPPLVDYVRCLPSMQLVPLRPRLRDESSMPRHCLYPEMDVIPELPHGVAEWSHPYRSPQYISMFDDTLNQMVSCGQNTFTQPTNDPLAAIEITRKIAISHIIAFLRRRYLNILRVQRSQFNPDGPLRHNYLCSVSEGALSQWHKQMFDFIVGSCAAMKEFRREVEDNTIALGLPSGPHMHVDSEQSLPQWEIDGWRSVQDLARAVDDLANSLRTGYMQFITIQEARIANSTAQSVSKITVLTMLFIPLSTIAGIFSMGGDFLPGSSKSWMFWAVCIPVLLALMYFYWRQHINLMLKKGNRCLLPMFEKKSGRT